MTRKTKIYVFLRVGSHITMVEADHQYKTENNSHLSKYSIRKFLLEFLSDAVQAQCDAVMQLGTVLLVLPMEILLKAIKCAVWKQWSSITHSFVLIRTPMRKAELAKQVNN